MVEASQLRAMQKGAFNRFKRLDINSINNFPTAAGLASSASGMASLAFGLSVLYGLDGDVAALARRGSGSACRSMFGGIVHWKRFPSESKFRYQTVEQLFPHTHWPELRVLICVTSSHSKPVSSSVAMRRTVSTSPLFREARATVVRERLPRFVDALARRDFPTLAELTMRESNELHALCLDSWPPAIYLNATSFAIIDFVHTLNARLQRCVVAYTFDAGPNAFLLTLADDAPLVLTLLSECFRSPSVNLNEHKDKAKKARLEESTDQRPHNFANLEVKGIQYASVDLSRSSVFAELLEVLPRCPNSIQYVLSTEVSLKWKPIALVMDFIQ
ncbi:unnamed protein product [Mesocestoides corti]|uniref:Uncharacterized protein n=1 Tax=Mesocestoides corti TaxID=53468 RepID=A0A0R3UAJ5_MESCO|nr:unnamed protein product [Mesocestoides corti]